VSTFDSALIFVIFASDLVLLKVSLVIFTKPLVL
jgi:hypothetical protein